MYAYSLSYSWDSQWWEQNLSLILWLASRNLFPILGSLPSLNTRGAHSHLNLVCHALLTPMFMALSEQKRKIVDGGNGEQEGGETVLEMYKKRINSIDQKKISIQYYWATFKERKLCVSSLHSPEQVTASKGIISSVVSEGRINRQTRRESLLLRKKQVQIPF